MTDAEFLEHLLANIPPGAKHFKMPPEDYARLYKLANTPVHGITSGKTRPRSAPRVKFLAEKAQQRMIAEVAEKLNPRPKFDPYLAGAQWTADQIAKIRRTKIPQGVFGQVPTMVIHDEVIYDMKTGICK